MGVVFAAYDPELDRNRRGQGAARRSASGQRAASSGCAAKPRRWRGSTHPNVVRVYDVGVDDDSVFVAMELVAGGTLSDWLAAAPRAWPTRSSRSSRRPARLAAAHDAGPRPPRLQARRTSWSATTAACCVTDFGLARPRDRRRRRCARQRGRHVRRARRDAHHHARRRRRRHARRTWRPSSIAGGAVDARADQFSFCVSLWEALYGEPPYAGDTARGARRGDRSGASGRPPRDARPAARARGAGARPGRPSPTRASARCASCSQRSPAIRRGSAVACVPARSLVALWSPGSRRPGPSAGESPSSVRLARRSLRGHLGRRAAPAVARAFVATGVPYAETTFAEVARPARRTTRRVDRDAQRQLRGHARARRQSDSMFDLRSELSRASAPATSRVRRRYAPRRCRRHAQRREPGRRVGDVTVCGDVSALSRRAPLPDDPQRRKRSSRSSATSSRCARSSPPALSEAEPARPQLVDRARAAGYAPLLAEALEVAAKVQDVLTQPPAAEKLFEEQRWRPTRVAMTSAVSSPSCARQGPRLRARA